MQYPVRKEKSDLLVPVGGNSLLLSFRGNVTVEDLKEAVVTAAKSNWLLGCKAVRDGGEASLHSVKDFSLEVFVEEDSPSHIIAREEKRRFAIEDGELCRFFILYDGGKPRLLIYAHPLAGDGVSLCFLAEDIMRALSGEMPSPRMVSLVEGVYTHKAMRFYLKWFTALLKKNWQKKNISLSFENAKELHQGYWQERESRSFFRTIYGEDLERLSALARIHGSSLSTAVAAALLKASGGKTQLKLCPNLRSEETGMGDFITDLWIFGSYNENLSFWENAKALQKQLERQYHDPRKLGAKGILRRELGPALSESAAFYSFGQLGDFSAGMASRLLGYRTPGGLGLCDLQSLPIPIHYRDCAIDELYFIPALTPDLKKTVGVSVLGGSLTLSLHVLNDSGMPGTRTVFEKAVDTLLKL